MQEFFNWIGTRIGEAIHFVVDLLVIFFANIGGAMASFVQGLSAALGINPTLFSLVVLLIGLWLLYHGVRALLQRRIIGALILAFLGFMVLSWLMR
ncbi:MULTISPECIES: hypothetical protein [Halomonadaceae]|uniref:hypothetical protein n=1 Tax=Halomonadaceae TaxID=28256 RepID=UPI0015974354|nr:MULTISPECIES: hypothetical protein [Halomonas]QJQ95322.1 hypothetical protein HIO72_08590 [Halomonas sp. PA5]